MFIEKLIHPFDPKNSNKDVNCNTQVTHLARDLDIFQFRQIFVSYYHLHFFAWNHIIIVTYSDIYKLHLEKWQNTIILHISYYIYVIVKHIFLFNVDGIGMVYMISK